MFNQLFIPVEIIVLILCSANCLVFHHLLYYNENVTFSGCISISNLQSSNKELEFVLEALFCGFPPETFVESSRPR